MRTGKGQDVARSALEDYYDFERFFGDAADAASLAGKEARGAADELFEDELDLLSAAGNYAAFLRQVQLDEDVDNEF